MTNPTQSNQPREDRLNDLIAEFLRRVDRGEDVDPEEFIAPYPELAESFAQYLEDAAFIDGFRQSHGLAREEPPANQDTAGSPTAADETIAPSYVARGEEQAPEARQFGRYRLIKLLGQGAMGAVYLAEDPELRRQVALKIPKFHDDQDAAARERFLREARAVATISHPNICQVYDIGEQDGTPFITMAYIQGKPLSRFTGAKRQWPERDVAKLVRKVALALAEAHAKGVVHRDLKPGNIMLDHRHEPIVMDFGLAGGLSQPGEEKLTQTGMLLGTPAYMAPEQAEADFARVGAASDVYSLGVICYELLTGQLPFQGPMAAVIVQIVRDEPRPPSELRPSLDERLEAICLKMMAKSPDDRYATAAEVAAAVRQFLEETAPGSKPSADPAQAGRELELQKREIVGLLQGGQFGAAIETLEKLGRVTGPGAAPYAKWARGELARVRSLPAKVLETGPALVETAIELIASQQYAEAVTLLEAVPADYRSTEAAKLLDRATKLQAEADELNARMQHAVHTGQYEGLQDDLARLLELQPGNLTARDLYDKLSSYAPGRPYRFGKDGKLLSAQRTPLSVLLAGTLRQALRGHAQRQKYRREPAKRRGSTPTEPAPAGPRLPILQIAIAAGALAMILLTIIVLLRDGRQTVRVEIDDSLLADDSITLRIDDRQMEIAGLGETIKLAPGDHGYELRRGDEVVRSGNFTVLKGDNPALEISLGKPAAQKSVEPEAIAGRPQQRLGEPRLPGVQFELGPTGEPLPPATHLLSNGWRVGEPVNLGPTVNSDAKEFCPALSANGLTLVFCSDRPGGQGGLDLWMSSRASVSESFGRPVNLGPTLNSGRDEGGPTLSPDGLTLVFNSNRPGGWGENDLWMCTRTSRDEQFKEPTNLGPTVNSDANQFGPALTANGLTLIFTSNRQDEHRRYYLWMCTRPSVSESFGKAVKLGPLRDNSLGESHPDLSADGLTLLFASHRGVRLSPPDLWMCTRQSLEGPFDQPVNLGPTVNSSDWDASPALSADGRTLFFDSDRPGGGGDLDLWMARIEQRGSASARKPEKAPPLAIAPFNEDQAKRHQQAWADYLGVPVETTNSIGMKLALIPPGRFAMETAEGEPPGPVVTLTKPFYLGAHEVTVAQFREFVEATSYRTDAERGEQGQVFDPRIKASPRTGPAGRPEIDWRNPGYPVEDNHPVARVSWADADAFCQWLSRTQGQTYRLPTEAEWEYSCRAGTTTTWACGDEVSSLQGFANLCDASIRPNHFAWADEAVPWDDGYPFTAPVGSFRANAFGLHDMHGNCWEICQDRYGPLDERRFPATDPAGPETGPERTMRGGGWNGAPEHCDSLVRIGHTPSWPSNTAGFRVACTIDEAPSEPESGFTSLFDGRSLDGWHGDPRLWRVVDGAIVGDTKGVDFDMTSYLCTKKKYRDFILKAKFKLHEGNSGIQFRSEQRPDYQAAGPQAEIGWLPAQQRPNQAIGLYFQSQKREPKWTDRHQVRQHFSQQDWNEYVITCRGRHIAIELNGHTTVDYVEDAAAADSGVIGFQIMRAPQFGVDDMRVEFKDIRIKELPEPADEQPEPGFERLFDGRTLNGFQGDSDFWHVEEGTIVGRAPVGVHTFLSTERSYSDFVLKAKFKLVSGNSGIQIRSRQLAGHKMSGLQVDIVSNTRFLGRVTYLEGDNGTAMGQTDAGRVAQAYRSNDWNEFAITCRGSIITVTLNGHPIQRFGDQEGRFARTGMIGFQLFSPQRASSVVLKDIRIREL